METTYEVWAKTTSLLAKMPFSLLIISTFQHALATKVYKEQMAKKGSVIDHNGDAVRIEDVFMYKIQKERLQ